MGIKSTIQNWLKRLPFSNTGSGDFPFGANFHYWNNLWSSRTGVDFASEMGHIQTSPIVVAGVTWVGRNLASARPMVVDVGTDMKEVEVQDHPLTKLLKRPNPYYSLGTLCKGIASDWIINATAFLRIVRDNLGQPVELWWEPFDLTRPVIDPSGALFIAGFEIKRNGVWYPIPLEDIIVLRDGVDMDTRCGMSATSALVRDYYTDKAAAGFTALLLKNGLVPPVVVGLGSKDYPYTGNLTEFKDELLRKMSGDKAGEPMVTGGEVNVQKLGFDYSSIGLRDLRQVPQQAFCSAIGISPTSLYFDTSRKESTFANVEQFLKHDYRSYIVPLHCYIADELTATLLPEFDDSENRKLCWDYSQVAIMQPDQIAMFEAARGAFKDDILKRSEAREMLGYKWESEDEVYFSEVVPQKVTATTQVAPPPPDLEASDMPDDAQPTKAARNIPPSVLDEGADYWRESPVLDDTAKALIDSEPYVNGKVS